MTAWVLGADISLRRTGLAAIGMADGKIEGPYTWLAATEPPGVDGVAHRVRRLTHLRTQVARVLTHLGTLPVLALVEAPSYGSHDAGYHENAGAWWAVTTALVEAGIPVGTCAPMTRAKWATGEGNADKAAVRDALRDLWPDAGCTARTSSRWDECDSLALATAGAQRLGWPVPVRGWHGASLQVIRWPTLPAVTPR